MRKQIHPRLIGLFVVGGFIIAFLMVVIVGGGSLALKRKHYFVMYFDGSLNGLSVGSAVKFRGVVVGTVSQIMVQVDQRDKHIRVPVIIQIDPGILTVEKSPKLSDQQLLDVLIQQGLRAKLQSQSLISGSLYIDLDFHPDTPIDVVKNSAIKYQQIPTLPSEAEALSKALQSGREAFQALTEIVKSKRIEKAFDSFTQTMNDSRKFINEQMTPTAKSVNKTFNQVNQALKGDKLNSSVSNFNDTMADARSVMGNLNRELPPATDKFDNAMTNFSDAMYSFNALSSYLSRHPEALLRGKKQQKVQH